MKLYLKPNINKKLKKDLYKVMGKKLAKRELNLVWEVDPELFNVGHVRLSSLFTWSNTPQTHDFWACINRKINAL